MITPRAPEIIKETTLHIPDAQYKKLYAYIDQCETEVGGLATIKELNDTEFEIDEIFITRQTAAGAYLRLEDADILRVNSQLAKKTIDTSIAALGALGRQDKISIGDIMKYVSDLGTAERKKNKLILQWHSHVRMGTFASGTDYDTALRLSLGQPFYFMLIMNKMHDNTCYMMTRKPIGSFEKIKSVFNKNIDISDIKEQAKAEIDTHVFHHSQYEVDETTGKLKQREIHHEQPTIRSNQPEFYNKNRYGWKF